VDLIKTEIVAGVYQPGDKLPSVRELAAEASVNPNTMQRALTELERSGLVYTQRTSGRFITEDTNIIMEIREQLAREQLQLFLENMKRLGFTADDIRQLLNTELKEGQ
jgi:DNA-binding transcriptional regulator YhcF (GntR family)